MDELSTPTRGYATGHEVDSVCAVYYDASHRREGMEQADLAGQAVLRDGRTVTIRPLKATDVDPLATFFLSLSAETRQRYAPHPFDRATAQQLCLQAGAERCMRFVVVLGEDSAQAAILGYLILNPEISANDQERYRGHLGAGRSAGIAPAVADAYQHHGVGSLMARHVIACARSMGLQQLTLSGGVRAFNESAIRFYEKLGFRQVGEFWTRDPDLTLNYAMILDL
jgi:diamine N-acetyltransferase